MRTTGGREPTQREHAGEIQREYGYRDFCDPSAQRELLGWLDARAWATAERPSVLFDLATARLIEAKVLLPGASVLARPVASARDRAAVRLYRTLAEAATERRHRLEQLLEVPDEERLSPLEVLRTGPRKLTASEAAAAANAANRSDRRAGTARGTRCATRSSAASPATRHLRHRLLDNPDDRLDCYELRPFEASYMLNVLGLEPWVIAEQLCRSDGGALVVELYGHPERGEAINRIRRAYRERPPISDASGELRGKRKRKSAS